MKLSSFNNFWEIFLKLTWIKHRTGFPQTSGYPGSKIRVLKGPLYNRTQKHTNINGKRVLSGNFTTSVLGLLETTYLLWSGNTLGSPRRVAGIPYMAFCKYNLIITIQQMAGSCHLITEWNVLETKKKLCRWGEPLWGNVKSTRSRVI